MLLIERSNEVITNLMQNSNKASMERGRRCGDETLYSRAKKYGANNKDIVLAGSQMVRNL